HGLKEYRAIQRVKEIRHAHLLPIHAFWMLDDQDQLLQDDVLGSFDHLTSTGRDVAQPPHRKPMTLVVAMTLADGNLFDLLLPPDDQQQRMQVTRGDLLRYVEDSARAVDYLNSP